MIASSRNIFETRVLPGALGAEINLDLVNQARDIQKRFDIGDDDFRKIFQVAPQSQAKTKARQGAPVAVFQGKGDYGNLPLQAVPMALRSRFKGRIDAGSDDQVVQLGLTDYGQKLFERAGEIQKIRNETDQLRARNSNISRVRARRTGLPRR